MRDNKGHKKEQLKEKVKELRERYNNMLGRFNYFKNCLLIAKETVRQGGWGDEYESREDALKRAIARNKEYKFIIKCESEELRALKYAIRALDRQMRLNSI